jgi:hypothetical protein
LIKTQLSKAVQGITDTRINNNVKAIMRMAINGAMDYVMNEVAYDGKVDFFGAIPTMKKNAGEDMTAALTKLKMPATMAASLIGLISEEFKRTSGPNFANLANSPDLVALSENDLTNVMIAVDQSIKSGVNRTIQGMPLDAKSRYAAFSGF